MSTAAIILAYVVIRVATAVGTKNAEGASVQLTIVSAVTIIYIFLCLLLIEDVYVSTLRRLRPLYRWAEFVLRVVVLVTISILPTFLNLAPTLATHTSPADRIASFLIILYIMFLSWDAVIYLGASAKGAADPELKQIALGFFQTDGAGIVLLIAAEGSRFVSKAAGAAVLCIFIPFAFWFQIRKAFNELVNTRFSGGYSRDMLR